MANRVVILKPRPAAVSKVVGVDLPFPLQKTTTSFQELRLKVLSEFEKIDELELVDSSGI